MSKPTPGQRIIKGLKQAVAFMKGDESQATVWIRHRCGCCDRHFWAPKGTDPIFCKKCEG